MGALPPVFIEFLGKTTGVSTAVRGVKTELATVDAEGAGSFKKTGMLGKAAILGLGVAAGEVARRTVQMAGDFQQQMTRVRTGAGEAANNMKLVSSGVLAMAGQVGQSTSELTAGLYMTESASYHGTAALNVLRTAAEGAKVGNADLKTTTDAVTTAMNAYKSGAASVVPTMNALIATESEGKTNLEDLAGSMSSILPTAAAAKVGLNEILGAMATMTAQGTPARVAATYLRQTIGQLSNPTARAADEMKNLGLSSVQVAQELGTKGLAATLTTLTDAIQAHMGPAGTVIIQHLRGAAKSATDFQKVLANLPPTQQTYIGSLATMVGGTKSMMAALQLTGPHMADFQRNTAGVAEHVRAGGKSVEGWADVQKNFNQKTAEAKASLQAMGIQIGQILMPYVQAMVSALAKGATWLTQHAMAAKIAAGIIGGILVFALIAATAALVDMAIAAAANPMTWIVLGIVLLIAELVLLAMHWRQVWDGIKAVASSVGKWLSGAWDDIASHTTAIWNSIVNSVMGAWRSVAGFFVSAWHMVADPVVGAWNRIWATTTAVFDAISGWFRKWWPLLFVIFFPFIAGLVALWNHFHEQVFSVARSVWSAISAFLSALWAGIQVVAGVVWAAIRITIITPMQQVYGLLKSLWTTAAHWLSALWSGIYGTASSLFTSIKKAMTGPLSAAWGLIKTLMGSIKSTISSQLNGAYNAVTGIGGKFEQIGRDIVMGIVHGVEGSGGQLKSELGNLAHDALSSAKSFLGINSPSKLFADHVGSAIPEGIALGVATNAHLAHTAITDMAGGTVTAFSQALEINSPSKKFRALGAYVVAGLVGGLTGTESQVKAAGRRIAESLYTDFGTHQRALQNAVARDNSQLLALARHRDGVADQLKGAQKKLADLQKSWASEKASVASGIMQSASIITASPEEGRGVNAGDVLAQMQQRVQAAQQFAAELDDLRKKGLRSDLIQQLATAGVDQAGATALALDGGSKSQIAAMNQMQASLQGAANNTGAAVANSMYGAGIQSAKGLIRGLQSQEAAIEAQMLRIAQSMQAAIKKALGIRSPSRVFADLGQFIPQGLAQGIAAGTHHATAAVTAMGGAVAGQGLGIGALGVTGGRPSVTYNITVPVAGHVTTDRQLVGAIQEGLLDLGSRNPATYPSYVR
ncbi:phage tail tape measure protein [Streptomyces sp. V4-01]|uniref:Phage tail tape measure protein n=1 Tax=Actinacidiphila polyblastidii TaxID=3110430 RepID=A0ABU7PLT5_9ACTN|nr:phage tail tape measure protein [Streptomyces sp. V4-01]